MGNETDQVGEACGMKAIDDPRVGSLIAEASAAHWGRPPVEVAVDDLERRVRQGLVGDAFEQIGRQSAAAADRVMEAWTRIDELLRATAELLRVLTPEQTVYGARRAVVLRFRAIDRDRSTFTLKPEPTIALPPDAPPPPPRDTRFEHLFHLQSKYWLDPAYAALDKVPPSELPDGAMLALCSLWPIGDTALRRGDDWGVLDEDLLRRYGTRLKPAALHYLAGPAAYGWHPEVKPNAARSEWVPPAAGYMLAEVAAEWPAPDAEGFLRLLLEAGWNYASHGLPDQPWARALLAEFKDSPYGHPDRPIWAL